MLKKHGLILLAVGLPLLGMMGCTGVLVVAGVVAAASQSDGAGQYPPTQTGRAIYSQNGPIVEEGGGQYVMQNTDDTEGEVPQQTPTRYGVTGGRFGMTSGGMPMPDSPNYVQPYDAMANTPGTRGFDQLINDQSDIQNNQTGEVSRDVDNSVAYPAVESGSYSSVGADAPAPAAEPAPSGE